MTLSIVALSFLTLKFCYICGAAIGPLTYWFDKSCQQENRTLIIEDAFGDALHWASRGAERLVYDKNEQQEQYFQRLFLRRDSPDHNKYQESKQKLIGKSITRPCCPFMLTFMLLDLLLGNDEVPGVSEDFVQVSEVNGDTNNMDVDPSDNGQRPGKTDRQNANFRFYCDDDDQDGRHPDRRWQPKPDPPVKQRPREYKENKSRLPYLRASPSKRRKLDYREYEDIGKLIYCLPIR